MVAADCSPVNVIKHRWNYNYSNYGIKENITCINVYVVHLLHLELLSTYRVVGVVVI